MNKAPTLRFKGSESDYEMKKISSLLDRVSNSVDINPIEFYRQIGIRSHGKGIFHKEAVNGESLGNKRVFWVEPNVFILNIVFAWERAIAKTTDAEIGMIASHRFPMYRPKSEVLDLDYITLFFKTNRGKYLLELASPGGAGRNKTLGQKEFENLELAIPVISEQKKIASFFSLIDKKIELQTEKVEELKNYKKGIMQTIFSQELRFKDENGSEYPEWEEKRLGEIGYFKTSSVDKNINENEEIVYLVNYMDVYRHIDINKHTVTELMKVSAKEAQIENNNLIKGDILFTPSSETPEDIGHSIVIFEDLPNTLYSYHLVRFRPSIKLNLLYSHYFCNIDSVRSQIVKFATGSTRFTVSINEFSRVKVNLPSYDEQKKIGTFLHNIDVKIIKEKEKLDRLVSYKKGLLQQMFI